MNDITVDIATEIVNELYREVYHKIIPILAKNNCVEPDYLIRRKENLFIIELPTPGIISDNNVILFFEIPKDFRKSKLFFVANQNDTAYFSILNLPFGYINLTFKTFQPMLQFNTPITTKIEKGITTIRFEIGFKNLNYMIPKERETYWGKKFYDFLLKFGYILTKDEEVG